MSEADAALVGLCKELTTELMAHQLLLTEVRPYTRLEHGRVEHVRGYELTGDELWRSGNGVLHDMTDAERHAGSRVWYSGNFGYTNYRLRGPTAEDLEYGDVPSPTLRGEETTDTAHRHIESFRQTVARAPAFTHDAVVHRGITDAEPQFGETGAKVGRTVTDHGFVSVTSNKEIAQSEYSPEGYGDAALVHVHIPAGTPGVLRSDHKTWVMAGGGSGPGDYQPHDEYQEYTIQPGSRYRIDSDRGDEDSRREIHVTLLPPDEKVRL